MEEKAIIEASVLRIGNLVLDHNNNVREVAYVGETIGLHNDTGGTDKYQKAPIFSYDITRLHPIELTPEILEKCGFGNEIGQEYSLEDSIFIMEPSGDGFMFTGGQGVRLSASFNYLHQLQNIYFAITGKELEINL